MPACYMYLWAGYLLAIYRLTMGQLHVPMGWLSIGDVLFDHGPAMYLWAGYLSAMYWLTMDLLCTYGLAIYRRCIG